jgi:isoaspartyl peptidase/L-asparaginase-like protein (Ntn-hydrolase superfamily)
MAQHNANYTIVPFASGTNGKNVCGDGISASTIHQVYCTGGGEVEITALGGGDMTVTLAVGQYVNVLCSRVVVNTGTFVGFRAIANRGNRLLG